MEAVLMTTVALVFLASVVAMIVIDVARLAAASRDLDAPVSFRGAPSQAHEFDAPAIADDLVLRKAA